MGRNAAFFHPGTVDKTIFSFPAKPALAAKILFFHILIETIVIEMSQVLTTVCNRRSFIMNLIAQITNLFIALPNFCGKEEWL
jgi:hypothetical protein